MTISPLVIRPGTWARVSPGLGDRDYGHMASLSTVGEAITRHNGHLALICDSYHRAAVALAEMTRFGDVVVSFGTGSPYLALDELAAQIERAS